MQHGDNLTLKNGTELRFLTGHPDDGACYIGMRWDLEKDEEVFETFECSDVTLVNGKPRTPRPYEVVNYLVPILNAISVEGVKEPAAQQRMTALREILARDKGGWEYAIHAAIQEQR